MLQGMSLDQLRYFVAVAEEEHMTRAARRLFISQPPLSRHIRALEEELDTRLFERTPKGLRLREEGRRLLSHVRLSTGCRARCERVRPRARRGESGATQRLSVGPSCATWRR